METFESRYERLCKDEPNDAERMTRIELAHALGVSDAGFVALAKASRTSETSTIILPAGDYGHTAKSKEWCRQGTGKEAQWGERVKGGWLVGPGAWTVYSENGRGKSDRLTWTVESVEVGGRTWTVAF